MFVNGKYFDAGQSSTVDWWVIWMAFWRGVMDTADYSQEGTHKVRKGLQAALKSFHFTVYKVTPLGRVKFWGPEQLPEDTGFLVTLEPKIRRNTAACTNKYKGLQCKHISTFDVLNFLLSIEGRLQAESRLGATLFYGYARPTEWNSLRLVIPRTMPDKVAQAKMRNLVDKGLAAGCACGCRGDFTITEKGKLYLSKVKT